MKRLLGRGRLLVALLLALIFIVPGQPALAQSAPPTVEALLQQLADANLREAGVLVDQLEQQGGAAMRPLFVAMLAGDLYVHKETGALMSLQKNSAGERIGRDVFSGNLLGVQSSRVVKKVRVNNRLRSQLRDAIARVNLLHGSAAEQQDAVLGILDDLTPQNLRLLQSAVDAVQLATLIELNDRLSPLPATDMGAELTYQWRN